MDYKRYIQLINNLLNINILMEKILKDWTVNFVKHQYLTVNIIYVQYV